MSDASRLAAPSSLWRHPDFLKLWAGQTISLFGSQFTMLALPLIAALTLRASPVEMGILSALETAPFLLVGLFVGVYVDRRRRRPILVVGDLGRGLVLASVPVAYLLGSLTLPHLYVVGFLVGLFTVFFDVAYQSYLPSLVGRERLVEGNSRLSVSEATAQIAGPSLAGVVVQLVSAPLAILVDGVSFFASAVALLLIRRPEPKTVVTNAPILADLREGLGIVFGNRELRVIAGCTATSNFFGNGVWALYVLYATRELGLSPVTLGLIWGVGSIAGLAGALFAGPIARRVGLGRAIIFGAVLGAFAYVPVALARPDFALPALFAGQLIGGLSNPVYNINQVSLRQAITPERLLGRMNATMRFLVWGTIPLGALVGGALGETLGLRPAIAIGTAGGFLAVVWVARSSIWGLKRIPENAL